MVSVQIIYLTPLAHGNASAAVVLARAMVVVFGYGINRHRGGLDPTADVAHIVGGADAEGVRDTCIALILCR